MSKTVAITEGDRAYRFGKCSYLRTNKQGGGYVIWVPEDDRDTTTKHITKNGTYKISDEKKTGGGKYYGYSQVTVNVPNSGKAVGKKPDGNTHVVQPDANGDLTDHIIPDKIKITTQPAHKSYTDGDTISKEGMVVKAYQGDGSLWEASGYSGGVIPNGELTLEPTTAHFTGGGSSSDEWDVSNLDVINAPFYMKQVQVGDTYTGIEGETDSRYITEMSNTSPIYIVEIALDSEYTLSFFISLQSFTVTTRRVAPSGWNPQYSTNIGFVQRATLHDTQYTAYVTTPLLSSNKQYNVETSAQQTYNDGDAVGAAVLVINNAHASGTVTDQSITVIWERPDDGKDLTDTFSIEVSPLR